MADRTYVDLTRARTAIEREAWDKALTERLIKEINAKARAGVAMGVMDLLTLEIQGGSCPKCGQEWNRNVTENRFVKVTWFDPACRCYHRCPRCEMSLHEEQEAGTLKNLCPNCGYRLRFIKTVVEADGRAHDEEVWRTGRYFQDLWARHRSAEAEDDRRAAVAYQKAKGVR